MKNLVLYFLFVDYTLTVEVNKVGVTIGPCFLTINKNNDIHKSWGKDNNSMCDYNFEKEITLSIR